MEEEGARGSHRSSKPAWQALRLPESSTLSPLRQWVDRSETDPELSDPEMAVFLTRDEELEIRRILDEMGQTYGFEATRRESYSPGFYTDRVWYTKVESARPAVVGFEIERGVPSNERLRKDILNLAWTRAPLGFLILPHSRILKAAEKARSLGWLTWWRDNGRSVFEIYSRPFEPYISVKILDADLLVKTRSLDKAGTILWTRRLSRRS